MKYIFILTFLTIQLSLTAQNTFQKTIDLSMYDVDFSAQQTDFGGYVIGGITEVNGEDRYLLAVTDENGDTIFTKTYDKYNTFDIQLYAIQASDGNYVLGPLYVSEDEQIERFCLFKTDLNGNELWSKTYSNNGSNCLGLNFIETSDNGYLLVGTSNYKPFIVKTDADGNKEWDLYISDLDDAIVLNAVETDDGYVIAGYSEIFSEENFFILKLDAFQNILWNKTYPGAFTEAIFLSLINTSDNGFLISSCTLNTDKINSYLLKFDSVGDTIWTRLYDPYENSYLNHTVETNTGEFISVGVFENCISSSEDLYILKTSTDGAIISQQMVSDENFDLGATYFSSTSDNGYIITGFKVNNSTYDWDVILIKTKSDGIVSINEKPDLKQTIKIFPNPASEYFQILFDDCYDTVNVCITDIQGKKFTNYDYRMRNEITINLKGLTQGIYIVSVKTENFVKSQKIIIN